MKDNLMEMSLIEALTRLLFLTRHCNLEPIDTYISPQVAAWIIEDARATLGSYMRTHPYLFHPRAGHTQDQEKIFGLDWDSLMANMWEFHEGPQNSSFPPGFIERYTKEQL